MRPCRGTGQQSVPDKMCSLHKETGPGDNLLHPPEASESEDDAPASWTKRVPQKNLFVHWISLNIPCLDLVVHYTADHSLWWVPALLAIAQHNCTGEVPTTT